MVSRMAPPRRFADQISYEPLRSLRPDPRNPRISPRRLAEGATDEERFQYIARHHDALTIAESIAEFGYFPSEPLIVIEEGGNEGLIVVEGNRRLTALRGLTDPALRATFTSRARWDAAAAAAQLSEDTTVPVIRAESRDAARPLIGYRHVAGIQKWPAFPKARFVAQMIDEGMSFEDAGERAALSASAARAIYRNYAILRQASERFGLDVAPVEDRFGVFTAALNRVAVRNYIGAPGPADVVPLVGDGQWPLPEEAAARLSNLLRWLNGEEEEEPIIAESRDLRRLASVLAEADGPEVLERTGDLDRAEAEVGLQTARVVEKLERARIALEAAVGEVEGADEAGIRELVEACAELVDRLRDSLP
jgi:hypothetical protein